MSFIKNIFFLLMSLILIAAMAIFIFFQIFDTDQYLPKIINKASLVIGRPVSIGNLSLGISLRGISFDAGPLIVKDDPNFTSQPFVKIDKIRVSLDLKSLILKHQIRIKNILLESPKIHFIRNQEGRFNISSLAQRAVIIKNDMPQKVINSMPQQQNAASPIKPSPETVNIIIHDADISYIDQNPSMPLDIWLKNVNTRINNFSWVRPLRISINGSLISYASNVSASIELFENPSTHSIEISDSGLNVDFSQLDLDELKGVSPHMMDSPFLKNISGIVQLNVGVMDLNSSGEVKVSGDLNVIHGVIKDFNIFKIVLSQTLGTFGDIEGKIENLLKDQLATKDTMIEKARAQFSYQDKVLSIGDSLLQTDMIELKAQGSVNQGMHVDLQTTLHLNNNVSDELISKIEGLKILCDESNRITMGGALQGDYPHLKYKPNKDFRKKSKRFFLEEGGNILGILLGGRIK